MGGKHESTGKRLKECPCLFPMEQLYTIRLQCVGLHADLWDSPANTMTGC